MRKLSFKAKKIVFCDLKFLVHILDKLDDIFDTIFCIKMLCFSLYAYCYFLCLIIRFIELGKDFYNLIFLNSERFLVS